MRYLLTLSGMLLTFSHAMSETAPGMNRVIAHRGASYDAPENTEAAIGLAIERGVKIVEFDVMASRDGDLFLFHDKELERLCERDGKFADLSTKEVRQLDVGSWFPRGDFANQKPPSLSAAIEQCLASEAIPLIEHKTGSADEYARVLQNMDAVDRVIVQSFDWAFLRAIKDLLPALRIGALGSKSLQPHRETLQQLQTHWVGWKDQDLDADAIAWLKSKGFKVAVWTVNDPVRARDLVSMGADRIITDRPQWIAQSLSGDGGKSGN